MHENKKQTLDSKRKMSARIFVETNSIHTVTAIATTNDDNGEVGNTKN